MHCMANPKSRSLSVLIPCLEQKQRIRVIPCALSSYRNFDSVIFWSRFAVEGTAPFGPTLQMVSLAL
jgi:hypothetical protein